MKESPVCHQPSVLCQKVRNKNSARCKEASIICWTSLMLTQTETVATQTLKGRAIRSTPEVNEGVSSFSGCVSRISRPHLLYLLYWQLKLMGWLQGILWWGGCHFGVAIRVVIAAMRASSPALRLELLSPAGREREGVGSSGYLMYAPLPPFRTAFCAYASVNAWINVAGGYRCWIISRVRAFC